MLIDHLRLLARQNNLYAGLSLHINELQRQEETMPPLQTFEKNNYIHNYIAQLPPISKKVIELKLIHGYSNKEIAHHLSIAVKTVESHNTKALRTIRPLHLLLQC